MGIWTEKEKNRYGDIVPKPLPIISTIVGIIVVIMLLTSCVVAVPVGHVGVVDLFGNVDANERQPGLQLKNPFAGVAMMSVKTQEYTMSYVKGEGVKYESDVISSLTKEGLSVDLDITVLYRLDPSKAVDIYSTIGTDYKNVIVRPQIRTVIREVIAKYEAKQIYSADRTEISLKIFEYLEPELASRGLIIEKVLLRHVQLPTELTTAIEAKLTAEQNIEKKRFEVQIEEQEAARKRIEAQGIADAQTIIDESLTDEYLKWYWIENLDTHNSVIYVPIDPQGMIDIGGR